MIMIVTIMVMAVMITIVAVPGSVGGLGPRVAATTQP